MCGRYVLATPIDELVRFFDAREAPGIDDAYLPSYNVAPTREVVCLALDGEGHRILDEYRWGLIPWWAKDSSIGSRLFNARAESVTTKPAFRDAFKSRRLAILADGFFEWRKDADNRRQPFYLTRRDGTPMAFAGLWDSWRDPSVAGGTSRVRSCTIVTTGASAEVAPIHNRMPVVLEPAALEVWLDADGPDQDEVEALLSAQPSGILEARPVGRRVGNVRNDDPSLVEPVEGEVA